MVSTRRLGDYDDVVRLYGRARELDALNQLVERTPDGGGAVVVRGEAGIGKSSLVAQAGRRAAALGMRTLEVRGVQSESHLPFAACISSCSRCWRSWISWRLLSAPRWKRPSG